MSKRSIPKKTRIRKGSSYVDNNKRMDSDESRQKQIDLMVKNQKSVDIWNTEFTGVKTKREKLLSEHFRNIQLEDGLVIQMYMENPIKHIVRKSETGEVIHIDYNVRQIDNRKQQTDRPNWVPTPFPVIDKGVIVAISPRTKLWYYEQVEKMKAFDPEFAKTMIVPEVGDVVYTKHFMFKDKRYYIDKQKKCEDLVFSQTEIRLNEFDFLFLIENYEIESIVKRSNVDKLADNQIMIENRYIDITSSELERYTEEEDDENDNNDDV